jgi:hypothetical protein
MALTSARYASPHYIVKTKEILNENIQVGLDQNPSIAHCKP